MIKSLNFLQIFLLTFQFAPIFLQFYFLSNYDKIKPLEFPQ